MLAAAVDVRTAYIHPHLGVASVSGEPFERVVGGKTFLMQTLVADPDPPWTSLLGTTPLPLAEVGKVTAAVPLDALVEGSTSWQPCPDVDLSALMNQVARAPFDLWVDQVSVPWPMKLVERCGLELADIAEGKDAQKTLADLLVQICDYLSMWHVTGANRDNHSVGQRVTLQILEDTVAGGDSRWSDCIGPTYVSKASGRELVVVLARVVAIISVGAGVPAAEVAQRLDHLFTERLRTHYDAMVRLALMPRVRSTKAA